MNLLLDTQVFLWSESARGAVRPDVVAMLEDPSNERIVSAATSWEIAIKYALGKLPLPSPPSEWVPDRMRRGAMTPLPISHSHALHAGALPRHHHDPFDRVLVAQAQLEGLPILTADRRFGSYDVEIIWA